MRFIRDQRTVHILRHFPAECLIKAVVFRRRRKILVSPHDMRDAHQMVIYHIRKIVSRKAVRFDQDHIVQFRIVHGNIAVNIVVKDRRSLRRIVLPDDIGLSGFQIRFNLLFGKVQTVFVVHIDFLARHFSCQRGKPVLVAETVIGFSFIDKLFGIF